MRLVDTVLIISQTRAPARVRQWALSVVSLTSLCGIGLSGCATPARNVPTVKIVREAPQSASLHTAAHRTSPHFDSQAPLLCDNTEMRARVADKNSRNDKARLLITEDDGISRKVIEDRMIDCKAYFASKGLRFATHTTGPTQRSLPAFVTSEPQSQAITRTRPTSTTSNSSQHISSGDDRYSEHYSHATHSQNIAGSGGFYEIKRGDNLYQIAKKTCTTVPILTHLNRISNPRTLDIGQILKLPEHSC